MIFGNVNIFAIECETTQAVDNWVYGKFRIWVNGIKIGSYSEEVLNLVGTTGVMRNPVAELSVEHSSLSSEQLYSNVREVFFGSSGYSQASHSEWAKYVWLYNSEGFETVFSVICKIGENIKIIWRNEPETVTNEYTFTSSAYISASILFLEWLKNIQTKNS
ncbi:MAG: Imm42 family immunity protein [Cellvibrio sp.]|uniref:Imm42 family immunity protein n=1 Tax=Cellvibrio sp. TaxID=1965322 RepID=UPI00271CEBD0|nr:Imm42 family immunity protein [Cellvibrio sp.]